MRQIFLYFLFSIPFIIASCTANRFGIFGKQSLHEQYGRKLTDAGLKETALGRQWFTAAEGALTNALAVSLPYKQIGYFAAERPRAVGIKFTAKRGEKLNFLLDKKPAFDFAIYADLWQVKENGKPTLLTSFDTTSKAFSYKVDENTTYLLRLQPELLRSGEYTLSISVGPSLSFPVAGKSGRIGSLWGDPRDAGVRKHEGIDIFAPFRTPAVAGSDGVITSVNEGSIGGKVVWLRSQDLNVSLYYAHLDQQLVSTGQRVKAGDTLGLVGNTGNAQTTSPHLHFGIYTASGAIDPFPFVNPVERKPPEVKIKPEQFNTYARLISDIRNNEAGQPLKKNTIVFISAANTQDYIVETQLGKMAAIPYKDIQIADNQISSIKIKDSIYVFDAPDATAPRKLQLPSNATVRVYGYYNGFAFIRTENNEQGWLPYGTLR
ncbi:MAG: M23 family metallopeptidase [Flavisolibacter sp.]|nr:M23 family metallopeptidase [Flavisolibacter sp.]